MPAGDPWDCELRPLLGLGAALIVSDGFISEELRTVYRRASALAMEAGDVDGAGRVDGADRLAREAFTQIQRATQISDIDTLVRRALRYFKSS